MEPTRGRQLTTGQRPSTEAELKGEGAYFSSSQSILLKLSSGRGTGHRWVRYKGANLELVDFVAHHLAELGHLVNAKEAEW